jgi:predicted nucleic acid-binding Zn ribbon protein
MMSLGQKQRGTRIGEVLPAILQQVKAQHGELFTVQREWVRLVGRRMASHTKPVSLRRGRLMVHADRPGENFELSYQRTQLLERLRTIAGGTIEEIVIRAGEVNSGGRGPEEKKRPANARTP